ncbi:MAG TPA: right-handed parallel beta-helix repeat-containing protein [Candidatus Latescibacteria bacterium]|nr:right-handed parallel beta-helix repeat-containing protein [Candidatus Latescibacterota bacterium]HOS63208.1 right-handed parallel beta-helix repeat-containing protein [Candidatus Latescibacterota bacterium]HPK75842.1 right-handed parallel beta-helix repeat-containing protein [Candidatus Latescibacterota bacterium]
MRIRSLAFALLFATLALFSAASHAETLVSGDVTTTAWTVSGSPYRVTGTVTVPAGNTLTIEPGVDVLFDADVQFIVQGSIQAYGTEAQNIRFMPGTSAEWGGIRLSGGQASTFQYVQFSGGKAEGTSPSNLGGALMVTGAGTSVNVSNCLFSGNGAASGGAVAFYTGGTGQFTATTFTGNTSTSWGGAAYIEGAGAITFSSCTFESNTSGTKGGAVAVYRSTGLISFQATEFRGNHSGSESGIVELYGAAGVVVTATFTDCLVENNTAASDAMIYGENYSNTTITNCVFRNNTGSSHGAGLELYGGNAFATVTGSVFANNTASRGAAMSIKWYATLNATNCTFVGNNITEAGMGGAVYAYYNTTVNLKNCVVWGNTPNQMYAQSTTINVTYSDVQGGWGGTGNIDADPLFVSAATGDYRLQPASPCIDTGDPATTDLDGTRADMGAFPTTQNTVSGSVSGVWYKANSPYRVLGPITIEGENSLIIEPGVDVLFDADVELQVMYGSLQAVGTAQDSIRFLRGHAAEWGGIAIHGGNSVISYARISGAATPGGDFGRADGGGLCVDYGTALISHCTISGNRAARWGGGVAATYNAWTTLDKCLITGNTADVNGSGASYYMGGEGDGALTITNSTIANNTAPAGAAALYTNWPIHVTVRNSILWADIPTGQIAWEGEWATVSAEYCDIQGGYEGAGNISADPMFVDGDFHLSVGSPCINAGAGEVANDPDGSPPDLGAFYFDLTGYVWGDLAGTWTRANSPYRVAAPVSVPYMSTLTIEPGVEVLFDADVPFVVEGSLQALGETGEGNGIRFVPGVAPEWGGLVFMGIDGPGGRTASPALERPAGVSGEGSSTILYAEISGGDADDLSETSGPMGVMGGGVSVFGTSVDIANSRIHNNQAMFGGGLAAFQGGIMLDSCVVENNVANAGLGGGFVAIYGGLMATDTEFRSNSAADTTGSFIGAGGGGGYAEESYAVFERCRFTGNTSAGNGGGVMLANDPVYGPPMEFTHCLFAGNTSAAGGGAYATVPMQGDKPVIRLPDSLRVGLAARPAAAARAQQEPGTAFVNCTFTENTATGAESGGGVPIGVKPAGTSDLLPMTYGGGLWSETSIPVSSSIVWGNTPDQITMGGVLPANKPAGTAVSPGITYSDVQLEEGMVWEGTGNINADPLFVNAAEGDYRLTAYSPCVNTGDPAGIPDPNGTRADMGAFPLEFKTGDVTMDGNITGQDASKVLQFSVKLLPSIPFALADVTNNGRATALDAALILYKLLHEEFIFPVDEGFAPVPKLAIPANPRTLTWERSGSAWELRADNPDGLMAGEFAFTVGSDIALSAEAGEYYAANRDGEVIRVAFARTDFTSPVLVRLVDDGRLLAPPSIASMELNDGATPILRVVRPVEFALEQNTPNPFNPTTTIRFGLPVEGRVQLVVYDVTGRVIRTLVDNQMEAGVHAVTWDGRDAVGRDAASGTYIYRLVAPNGVLVKRMVMVK